jgi:riboflavin synthase
MLPAVPRLRRVFTGIVEEMGTVVERRPFGDGLRLRIAANTVLDDVAVGASIAVNGCCLTVVEHGTDWWATDVSSETMARTNLGSVATGSRVNLERPLSLQARLGGHIVLGHVDFVGHVVVPAPDLRVQIPAERMNLVVDKGSITVDGVSLTTFDLTADTFDVAVIPHTAAVTSLGTRQTGDAVNIELDVLAKHIQRLLAPHLLPLMSRSEGSLTP